MDENKKPGARDISDLKARLGLKKTGTMAAVPGADAGPGAAPPPGGAAPIPAPFGQPAAPPSPFAQPAAPAAPPDPRRDPFAQQQAANLAAFYGIGQALPGSDDGTSAAPMEKKKPWGMLAGVGLGALGIFIVGSFWGGISKTRVEFNETSDHAVLIRNEVDKLQKSLDKILAEVRKSGGKLDVSEAQRLGELELKKPSQVVLFHTNYVHLEGMGMERLFSYYNDTIKLYDDITAHTKKTKADAEAIQRVIDSATKNTKNYGVVINATGAVPLASFAEVGAPVCPTPGQVDCKADELKGFKYRLEAGQAWSEKPLKGKLGETITPLQRTPLFDSVVVGSADAVALEAYKRRQATILELVGNLEKTQKELAVDLKRTAERPKVFTF